MSRKVASKAGLVGLVLFGGAAALSACSSSDNNGTGGTAGTTSGTAGKSGTAGSTSGTAGSGTGTAGTGTGTAGSGTGTAGTGTGTAGSGAGGGSGFACAGVKPTGALITDFGDLVAATSPAGQYTFGGMEGLKGGTFSYQAGALTYTTTDKALEVKGNIANYDGFGIYFNSCTDASAYTGVSFTVKGSVGTTGKMNFSFQTNADQGIDTVNMHGTCPTADLSNDYNDCHFAQYQFPVTATATTVTIHFNDTQSVPGLPVAAVDGKDLLGLQWSFAWAGMTDTAYDADVTIDDVMFIGGTSTGTGGAGGTSAGGSGGASGGTGGASGGTAGASGGTGGAAGGAGGTGGAH